MTSHDNSQPTPEQLADERWLRCLMDEVERQVHAPRRLRLQIEASARARRRAVLAGLPGAMAAALATALLAVFLIPGGPAAPSFSQAAALASRGAAGPPPTPDPDDPGVRLSENVNDVYFPNWSSTLGWRPTGMRRDLLDLHRAATVYYAYGTRRLAYTILSARPGPAGRRGDRRERDNGAHAEAARPGARHLAA